VIKQTQGEPVPVFVTHAQKPAHPTVKLAQLGGMAAGSDWQLLFGLLHPGSQNDACDEPAGTAIARKSTKIDAIPSRFEQ